MYDIAPVRVPQIKVYVHTGPVMGGIWSVWSVTSDLS